MKEILQTARTNSNILLTPIVLKSFSPRSLSTARTVKLLFSRRKLADFLLNEQITTGVKLAQYWASLIFANILPAQYWAGPILGWPNIALAEYP